MHIESEIVTGARLVLSYATGIATGCVVAKFVVETIRERGALSFAMQASAATGLVFTLVEILPHFAVGVSEVHFVLGLTLLLLSGAAAGCLWSCARPLAARRPLCSDRPAAIWYECHDASSAAVCDPGARQTAQPVQGRLPRSAVR